MYNLSLEFMKSTKNEADLHYKHSIVESSEKHIKCTEATGRCAWPAKKRLPVWMRMCIFVPRFNEFGVPHTLRLRSHP